MRVRGRTESHIESGRELLGGADRTVAVHFDHAFLPSNQRRSTSTLACKLSTLQQTRPFLKRSSYITPVARASRDRCACRPEADADAPEHCRQWDAIVCTTTHDPRPVRRGSTRIERHGCSYCCCRQWELVALAAGRSASTVSRDAACFGGWRICDGWLRQQRATCREAVQSQSH